MEIIVLFEKSQSILCKKESTKNDTISVDCTNGISNKQNYTNGISNK